ncbi:MAG: DUF11 domain-containing protein [Polyangia bacterium]
MVRGLGLVAACSVGWGCSAGDAAPDPADRLTGERPSALLGSDGSMSFSGVATVNQYFRVVGDVAVGAASIAVTPGAALGVLKVGDLALLHQAQGAEIDSSDAASYGTVTDLKGAGLYELITVSSVDTATGIVGVAAGCGRTGTRNAYSAAGKTQLVRVPQYTALNVQAGGTLSATPWNGSTGGIVAVVAESAVIDGAVRAGGSGFQGGAAAINISTLANTTYRTDVTRGGQKGEGVAGGALEYQALGGAYGRGAPANGGGGGNSYNAAGGGGGGASNGKVYSGAGVMDTTRYPLAAWKLDPEYDTANDKPADSSGGGRGGYALSTTALSPTAVPPGDASWGGGSRASVGGRGGHALALVDQGRLFFGGGGGAGHGDNNTAAVTNAGRGGSGGGIVLLLANTLRGGGTLSADGQAGGDSVPPALISGTDGPGGGGGGGTVLLLTGEAQGVTSLRLSAVGGAGGVHRRATTSPNSEATGGGGGGGGGALLVAGTGLDAATLGGSGGAAGTTTSDALATFAANGATDGAAGVQSRLQGSPMRIRGLVCAPADLRVTLSDSLGGAAAVPGQDLVFTVVVRNDGPNPARGTRLGDTLPVGVRSVTWACSSTSPGACPAASGSGALSGAGALDLVSGASATFTVTMPVTVGLPDLSYEVTVTPPALISDPDAANNTARDPIAGTAPAGVDLQLVVSDHPEQPRPLEQKVLDVLVSNPGLVPALEVVVEIAPPAGVAVPPFEAGDGWFCQDQGTILRCRRGLLDPGSAPPIVLTLPRSCSERRFSVDLSSMTRDLDASNNHAEIGLAQLGGDCPVLAGGGLGSCATVGTLPVPPPLGPALLAGLGLGLGLLRRRRR